MKLSFAWIFDHLEGSWQKSDIQELAHQLTMTTAQVERVIPVNVDLDRFSLGRVTGLSEKTVTVESEEWDTDFSLPVRSDAHEGKLFLITKEGWATLNDFHAGKDGLFPAVEVIESQVAGDWKKAFEAQDYVLEIDNVTLTHRPDLWSHRGFAREISAMTGIKMRASKELFGEHPVHSAERSVAASPKHGIAVEVAWPEAVPHFAGIYIKHVENGDCLLPIAHRLCRVEARPINALVDVTNYVMYDMGQPLHAFDAGHLKKLVARKAQAGEALTLLDGTEVKLTPQDIVIADDKKPLALAGIMGGATSGVISTTESIFLEAAVFDAKHIRATASRLKKRTDAAVRFEKGREPGLNVEGILRFLKIFHESDLALEVTDEIVTLGAPSGKPRVIELSHQVLERKMGVTIEPKQVIKILQNLEFGVEETQAVYRVTVPPFRNRDIQIPEDLVEEVVRCLGYQHITPEQPALALAPHDLHELMAVRAIKQHAAFSWAAHEVSLYSLYDEQFLAKIGWSPERVPLKNPVSEHYQALVTSLIPHLLKAVEGAAHTQQAVRFFEWNRVWFPDAKQPSGAREQKSLAAIFFDKKPINFYDAKAEVEQFFHARAMTIRWRKPEKLTEPWWSAYETAALYLVQGGQEVLLGHAGLVDATLFAKLGHGHAFAVELNGELLVVYHEPHKKFHASAKYPAVWLDISLLVPSNVTVAHMEAVIAGVDRRIQSVSLVDFFEKKEWANQRSLTLRYVVQDREKTLEKSDIAALQAQVEAAVKAKGAQVR